MSFTNTICQIFDASGYAYSIEYNDSDFNLNLPPLSNYSGITRRPYDTPTWSSISEVETFLTGRTFAKIDSQKVYKNGTDVIISFVEHVDSTNETPAERFLHIFTSTDGITFPTHTAMRVNHLPTSYTNDYYRRSNYYQVGNSIVYDRLDTLLKFDTDFTGNTDVLINVPNFVGGAVFGDLVFTTAVKDYDTIEIYSKNFITGVSTVQFVPIAAISILPGNTNISSNTIRFTSLNNRLYLVITYVENSDPIFIPSLDGVTFNPADAFTLLDYNVSYNATNGVYYYFYQNYTTDRLYLREYASLLLADIEDFTEYEIPNTDTDLNNYLIGRAGIVSIDTYHSTFGYLFRYFKSNYNTGHGYFAYKTGTNVLTNYYHGGQVIQSNGTGFVSSDGIDVANVSYSADLVTWTLSDWALGTNYSINAIAGFGWYAVRYAKDWTGQGLIYTTNGLNWLTLPVENIDVNVLGSTEPNILRLSIGDTFPQGSDNASSLTYSKFNTSTIAFDVLASGLNTSYSDIKILSEPFLIRNNITLTSKLLSVKDNLECIILSSDNTTDTIDLNLKPEYTPGGIAGFFDVGNELKFTCAYITVDNNVHLDIIHLNGSTWEVEHTINISDIYDLTLAEFEPRGGPMVITRAGDYYFAFGKLINVSADVSGTPMTGANIDLLLKGLTLDTMAPIGVQTVDLSSGVWTEAAFTGFVDPFEEPVVVDPPPAALFEMTVTTAFDSGSNTVKFDSANGVVAFGDLTSITPNEFTSIDLLQLYNGAGYTSFYIVDATVNNTIETLGEGPFDIRMYSEGDLISSTEGETLYIDGDAGATSIYTSFRDITLTDATSYQVRVIQGVIAPVYDPEEFIYPSDNIVVFNNEYYMIQATTPTSVTSGKVVKFNDTFTSSVDVTTAFDIHADNIFMNLSTRIGNDMLILESAPANKYTAVRLTTAGVRTVIWADIEVIKPGASNGFQLATLRVTGASDRYIVVGNKMGAWLGGAGNYYCMKIFDTVNQTEAQYNVLLDDLDSSLHPGANLEIIGVKIVDTALYIITWMRVSNTYSGLEIFEVSLLDGTLSSNSTYDLTPGQYAVPMRTDGEFDNNNAPYIHVFDWATYDVHHVYSIDDALTVALDSTTTLNTTNDYQFDSLMINAYSGKVIAKMINYNTNLLRYDYVDGNGDAIPTAYTYASANYSISTFSIDSDYMGDLALNYDTHIVNMNTGAFSIIHKLGGPPPVVDNGGGGRGGDLFDDPILNTTNKVRFGTSSSNGTTTHFLRNVVVYDNIENEPVYTIIAYQNIDDIAGT